MDTDLDQKNNPRSIDAAHAMQNTRHVAKY